jgi:hypothetical protein
MASQSTTKNPSEQSIFEVESVTPLSDHEHPRTLAAQRVKEFRAKKVKRMTQADLDRGAEDIEPMGDKRKLFWKASKG